MKEGDKLANSKKSQVFRIMFYSVLVIIILGFLMYKSYSPTKKFSNQTYSFSYPSRTLSLSQKAKIVTLIDKNNGQISIDYINKPVTAKEISLNSKKVAKQLGGTSSQSNFRDTSSNVIYKSIITYKDRYVGSFADRYYISRKKSPKLTVVVNCLYDKQSKNNISDGCNTIVRTMKIFDRAK